MKKSLLLLGVAVAAVVGSTITLTVATALYLLLVFVVWCVSGWIFGRPGP